MANTMSQDEKFMNQGADVEFNSENKRVQTVTVGPETDGADTKMSDQTAVLPGEDTENERVTTAYPEDTAAGTTTTTTTTA